MQLGKFNIHFKKMARLTMLALCLLSIILVNTPLTALAIPNNPYAIKQTPTTEKKVLFILAPDVTTPQNTENSRKAFSTFQQIASSYWNLKITSIEAKNYTPGLADSFDVTVIDDEFGNELPWMLVQDLINLNGKEVVHFGLGGDRLLNLVGFTRATPYKQPVPINEVLYKGVPLNGGPYQQQLIYGLGKYSPNSGVNVSAPIVVNDSNKSPVAIRVTTSLFRKNASGYQFFPFAIPRYYDTQSYTNAILDTLHLSFGNVANHPKQALLRLEDVNAYTYAHPNNGLFRTSELLDKKRIPFHIALIERYIDPIKKIDASTKDHRHFNYELHKMVGEGRAVLIQHGYTHQYKQEISGIGFEFWDDKNKVPAEGDSTEFATQKIDAAQKALKANNLPVPDIWETPHYALGDNANAVLNQRYPIRYENIHRIGSLPFPAVIDGTVYIPENLGYINGKWEDELNNFKHRLDQLQVFRNATPSFFWHPWRDTHEIGDLVDLLTNQGYTFVHAYDLLNTNTDLAGLGGLTHKEYRNLYSEDTLYFAINASVMGLYCILALGMLRYIYDHIRFRKYLKLTTKFRKTIKEIKEAYSQSKKELPTFAIFVPARNEGLVIANTIENLASLDYPKDKYQIVIITDVRELQDNVEILTKTEVQRKAAELNSKYKSELVKLVEVPEFYSGEYKDWSDNPQKSTKGRALNFALQKLKPPKSWNQVDFIGVLDADGRLHKDVLKEAAWEVLKNNAQILQGPVYQVSNLSKVSAVGVMAGLELARYHLTNMMPRLRQPNKMQFLAGTNYFMSAKLLDEVDGWDQHALVEDAELAVRVYTKKRVVAYALTLPEVEQTPATFKIYRRQRERWARGHFEILGTILKSTLPVSAKIVAIRKIFLSQFRFILDLSIPLIAVFFLVQGFFKEVDIWMQVLSVILLVASVFMWDIYGQTFRQVSSYSDMKKKPFSQLFMSIKLFVLMPAFIIIQAIPRFDAIFNFITRKKIVWVKTERTAEQSIN